MPQEKHYKIFAIVTVTVCVPFFVLIGSLNTNRGMHFWRTKSSIAFAQVSDFFAWVARGGKQKEPGLISAKSFDSTSSSSNTRVGTGTWKLGRRTSTQQRQIERTRPRAFSDTDEPTGREDQRQRKAEDGPPPDPMSPRLRPTLTTATEPASRLAEMWMDERSRRQRLRYRENV